MAMKDDEKKKLWDQYKKNKSPEIREKLIIEYANLVNLVAGRMGMYLGYTVEYDDLVGYGIFGLIDAIDKFDLTKNVKFETYASLRIRGSILDQIRKMDWVPRTLRQRQKQIDSMAAKIEEKEGRPATDAEIAKQLNVSEEEYNGWKSEIQLSNLISLDDYLEQGGDSQVELGGTHRFEQPEKAVEKEELKKILVKALETLTEKETSVITLYYYEDLTLKEISQILSVSESRVSQLHSRALQKMKGTLGDGVELLSLFN